MINTLRIGLLLLLLAGCTPARQPLPSATSSRPAAQPAAPTATLPAAAQPTATTTPTAPPASAHPLIHEQPGPSDELLFTIPAGKGQELGYFGGGDQQVNGPNALAVLPDGSFLISDQVGNSIVHYDRTGHLRERLQLAELGINFLADLRVRRNELFLLVTNPGWRVEQRSLTGQLIDSQVIPATSIADSETLRQNVRGFAFDCDGSILLEPLLVHLHDIQSPVTLEQLERGYVCNGQRYHSLPSFATELVHTIQVGEIRYITKVTMGGDMSILEAHSDGSLYLTRDDLVSGPEIRVDQTIHYLDPQGVVQGMARVPLGEAYYPIWRSKAFGPDGELYLLLPQPDSINIIRLNFYRTLPPLIPGAMPPLISRSTAKP